MTMLTRTRIIGGFVAGALSVLVFHQGVVLLANQAGWGPPAYSLAPTAPFGVPQLLSSAFWGGLWGILWALIASRLESGSRFGFAFLFGAILPPLVVVAIVVPLRGSDPRVFLEPVRLAFLLIVHGIFGVGIEVFLRLGRGRLW